MWNVIPGLSRFVGRGWGGQGAAGQDDRVPRSEPPVPRTPTPDEIPPLPSVAGRRKPRGKIAESAPPAPVPVLEALDIYTEHFGLTAQPFSITPDPDFLFWSAAHKRAYAMLEYGVMTHAPITLITGEVGAGKTTLLQHMLRSLVPEVKVGLISNPHGSRAELIRWVLMALDQPARPEETYVDLFSRFQAYVIDEYAQGHRVILIFDEAQNLDREALEELRMYTNINTGRDVLLQLVLVGQPELRDMISRRDMRQFAQRVGALFHLPAMDLPTVKNYVAHRLKVAGRERRLFTADAIQLIHEKTGGVPRLVNRLCDLSLVYAFTAGRKQVDRGIVSEVLNDGSFIPMTDASDPKGDA
ncbi:AAA family ATPase [Rhodobacter sp. HX-7-19]|uniref:AAA family ATPase n=1 Tax=Paragemmobacter kunshanensis TaxID=2583234 RepID=A0A6M1U9S2_9RHOB|nr:AAA family ATPase [Rhodobacter kunshanensis]NGQ92233.1 AAA family ATPase [Rhodobacter kunshanensis]